MISKFTERFPILGLLIAQFFGAFNDNAWKIMVFTLATRPLLTESKIDFTASSQSIATLSLLVFLIPMMLFSIPAGGLTDRFSKRNLLVAAKLLEIVLMAFAAIILFVFPHDLILSFFILGMMGVQSAFFGPPKYGILPELFPEEKLSKSNAFLEMWTMIAIIAGTGLGPVLLVADLSGLRPDLTWTGPAWLALFAIIGFGTSLAIPKVRPVAAKTKRPIRLMLDAWATIKKDNALFAAVLGNIVYWFIISLLGQNVLVYAKALVLELEKGEIFQGIPPASYGVGIALGALLAGKVSGKRIELGLIPLGAIAFSCTSMILGIMQPGLLGTVVILLFTGMASGLLVVPLKTIIQARTPNNQRGAIIALGNFLDVNGMIVGSFAAMGMAMLGISIGQMMMLSAVVVVLSTVAAISILPAALVRFCFIVLTRTFYKLKIRGIEHLPHSGACVLACNHISCIDALIVMASVDRPVHFIMNESYYNKWWLKPLAKLLQAIPLASDSNPKLLAEGVCRVGEFLDEGEVVCIFPEGQISCSGVLLPFKIGVELIMKGRNCPIVPLYIDGVWGSIFSYKGGRFFKKWPESRSYSMTVTYGSSLQADINSSQLRNSIQELEYQAWMSRKEHQKPMTHVLIRNVRRSPMSLIFGDQDGLNMSALKVLTAAIALGRSLKHHWKNESTVALLLPSGISAALCNIAVTLSGRPIVNLNFLEDKDVLKGMIFQAKVNGLITSRESLQKLPISLPDNLKLIYIEEILADISIFTKISSCLMALFYTEQGIEKVCGARDQISADDILTIIFTSGSTGQPKGVALTHFNVHSNVDGVGQVFPGNPKYHCIMHSLPLFHAFGYMMMWFGLTYRHTLVFNPNPLDYGKVGELVLKYKATIVMTTPTFLRGYLQRVSPEQFGSLKCVITGVEKLSETLAIRFEQRIGIRPIEGYGSTECSPVIATSVLNVRREGVFQLGTVPGSVGRPLPGVLVRVVDPQTLEELPQASAGLLLVKGPNVMQGYLNSPETTRKVMRDGWYITGDIAQIDHNGFIKITDRISRFSKLEGELVPHGKVEELLHQVAEIEERVFAVTGFLDNDRGEKLAVLHTIHSNKLFNIIKKLSDSGISKVYIPEKEHCIFVETLPSLASGKLDLFAMSSLVKKALMPSAIQDIP